MKKASLVFSVVSLSLGLFSCANSTGQDVSKVVYAFDTTVEIDLFGATQADADKIGSDLEGLSSLFDGYTVPATGQTTLYTLNHTNDPVTVDQRLADILSFALEMERDSGGYLNPLVGGLANLWKNAIGAATPYIPSDADIQACLATINNSSLKVEGNVVTRTGDAIIDLGALAKGYALRTSLAYLQEKNLTKYVINAGSSSMLVGQTKAGTDWDVNYRVYDEATYKLSGSGIATSAVDQQGAKINGKWYSHIVNPLTGSGESNYVFASLIGDDPGVDDALSTLFMLIGKDAALPFVDRKSVV